MKSLTPETNYAENIFQMQYSCDVNVTNKISRPS